MIIKGVCDETTLVVEKIAACSGKVDHYRSVLYLDLLCLQAQLFSFQALKYYVFHSLCG